MMDEYARNISGQLPCQLMSTRHLEAPQLLGGPVSTRCQEKRRRTICDLVVRMVSDMLVSSSAFRDFGDRVCHDDSGPSYGNEFRVPARIVTSSIYEDGLREAPRCHTARGAVNIHLHAEMYIHLLHLVLRYMRLIGVTEYGRRTFDRSWFHSRCPRSSRSGPQLLRVHMSWTGSR